MAAAGEQAGDLVGQAWRHDNHDLVDLRRGREGGNRMFNDRFAAEHDQLLWRAETRPSARSSGEYRRHRPHDPDPIRCQDTRSKAQSVAAARDRVLGHLSSVTPNGTGQVTGGGSGGAARDGSVRAIGGGSGSGSGAAVGGGSDGSGVGGSGAAVGGADSGSGPAVGNAATPQVTAGLPLLGLLEGEVTAQPLLTRLCGQLGALGVRDIILIAPP